MRSKFASMGEWDDQGHPIDTRHMSGEGYQVACPQELEGKHAHDLDAWAAQWLKRTRRTVRHDTSAHKRDCGAKLVIMTVDWKDDR